MDMRVPGTVQTVAPPSTALSQLRFNGLASSNSAETAAGTTGVASAGRRTKAMRNTADAPPQELPGGYAGSKSHRRSSFTTTLHHVTGSQAEKTTDQTKSTSNTRSDHTDALSPNRQRNPGPGKPAAATSHGAARADSNHTPRTESGASATSALVNPTTTAVSGETGGAKAPGSQTGTVKDPKSAKHDRKKKIDAPTVPAIVAAPATPSHGLATTAPASSRVHSHDTTTSTIKTAHAPQASLSSSTLAGTGAAGAEGAGQTEVTGTLTPSPGMSTSGGANTAADGAGAGATPGSGIPASGHGGGANPEPATRSLPHTGGAEGRKTAQSSAPVPTTLASAVSALQASRQVADVVASATASPHVPAKIHTVTAAGTQDQSAAAQAVGALVGVEPQQNGVTRLTISMAPPAIGSVTVHIDQAASGNATITVTATHPATLAALQNDHAALTQALTAAGIGPQHQTMSFHMDAPPAVQNSPAMTAGQGGMAQGGTAQGGNGQAGLANGQPGGHPGDQGNGSASNAGATFAQGVSQRGTAISAARVTDPSRLHRFGLDVTA